MRQSKETFIKGAKEIHGDKYDYSKIEYNGYNKKVCIICPEHGEFWQTPHNHIGRKSGCPKCAIIKNSNLRKLGIENFILKAREIHGDKYDYSKVVYVNNRTKVCIICPEHGEFWQTPDSHICQKAECPKCSKQFMNKEYFIECAKKIHNGKYDYSKVEYINNSTKVCIICPEHGEFWQSPKHHLRGFGCSKCSNNYLDKDFFIEKSQKVHGYKYDYSKVEYVNNKTKVCITCPEHGDFMITPNSHLNGKGCPKCRMSHLERKMELFLMESNIKYIWQYRDKEIFGKQSLDFYLPDYNIAIECQGVQHFMEVKYRSKKLTDSDIKRMYNYNLERDRKKKYICKKNNIRLISYFDDIFKKYINESEVEEYINNPEDLLSKLG